MEAVANLKVMHLTAARHARGHANPNYIKCSQRNDSTYNSACFQYILRLCAESHTLIDSEPSLMCPLLNFVIVSGQSAPFVLSAEK